MATFHVKYLSPGPAKPEPFYLRGTVWTGDYSRRTVYTSYEAARTAIDEAGKFNRRASKLAYIIPEPIAETVV